jgi:hypothetical protein
MHKQTPIIPAFLTGFISVTPHNFIPAPTALSFLALLTRPLIKNYNDFMIPGSNYFSDSAAGG